jgi:site-specific DNA-methyltransferase (adenine-specific)
MGKNWDSSGIAYSVELWRECLRVLKPGGHLLSFGGTRTRHRVAVGIEDAGFEVRDSIAWMYGSGFPKSLDVSKAIDKAAGAEREVTGHAIAGIASGQGNALGGPKPIIEKKENPITPKAQEWQGWGTALKPAFEPIVVARKPLIGTVAENVLTHGTGALNIDGSRIGTEVLPEQKAGQARMGTFQREEMITPERTGRWPANVILDEYSAELLDEQSGVSKSGAYVGRNRNGEEDSGSFSGSWNKDTRDISYGDTGGASRFFYCAKASKRDRNEGLEELEARLKPYGNRDLEDVPEDGDPKGSVNDKFTTQPAKNFHPTVKPTQLMRYLVKLVTPSGGTVLDPFTGSGSTGKAAILEGFRFIGCELTEDYIPIIEGRLQHAELMKAELEAKEDEALF